MGYLIFVLFALLVTTGIGNSGELYLMGFIEPNMAARADGGNPKSGVGIYQPIRVTDNLIISIRAEVLLDGRNRDGSKHDVSIRYTARIRYDYDNLFIEAERFAWNPISHVKVKSDMIGGGDTMSSWLIKTGVKW